MTLVAVLKGSLKNVQYFRISPSSCSGREGTRAGIEQVEVHLGRHGSEAALEETAGRRIDGIVGDEDLAGARLHDQFRHGAQGVGMRRRGQRGRTVKRDVRLDHHHVPLLDEALHAAERGERGADGFFVFRAVRDGERRQNLACFRGIAAKLQAFFFCKPGNKMVRLPELGCGYPRASDERAGDAEAHEKFAPADRIHRYWRRIVGIWCAHIKYQSLFETLISPGKFPAACGDIS